VEGGTVEKGRRRCAQWVQAGAYWKKTGGGIPSRRRSEKSMKSRLLGNDDIARRGDRRGDKMHAAAKRNKEGSGMWREKNGETKRRGGEFGGWGRRQAI